MRVTPKQQLILSRLNDVEVRRTKKGQIAYYLDSKDVRATVNSMIVRGAVVRDQQGRLTPVIEA